MPEAEPNPEPTPAKRARGRTLALAIFGLIVGAVTCVWSVQIIQQGFSADAVGGPLPATKAPSEALPSGCRSDVLRLRASVRRARQSAAKQETEQASVVAFRSALAPEWTHLAAVKRECREDQEATQALKRLEQLRYAEEHTVRYEARDVALWRRALDQLDERWAEAGAAAR